MNYQIINELKEIKNILAQLIGTAELPSEDQFSKAALEKAAKDFQKLATERGEWVADRDISKYIKSAP